MHNLAQAFKNQLASVDIENKESRLNRLQIELDKFVSKNNLDFSIPDYMVTSFEKGKSPNLSLSCFLNSSFKKTNLWSTFITIMKVHGRAIICFKSKLLGAEKSTWWCITDAIPDLKRGLTGIFISAGESVDVIRVVRLKDYLEI